MLNSMVSKYEGKEQVEEKQDTRKITKLLALKTSIMEKHKDYIEGIEAIANVEDYSKLVNATKRVFESYIIQIDEAIPFKQLRESLKLMDEMAQDYNGTCRKDIYKASRLGYTATDNFFKATDKIFRWCALTNDLVNIILNQNITFSEKSSVVLNITNEGIKTIEDSLKILETTVVPELITMHEILLPLPVNLKTELTNAKTEFERKKANDWSIIGSLFSLIVHVASKIVGFLTGGSGPVLFGDSAFTLLLPLGISLDVISKSREPTIDESIKINELLYTKLIDAVKNVQINVGKATDYVHSEKREVQILYGKLNSQLYYKALVKTNNLPVDVQLKKLRDTVKSFLEIHHADVNITVSRKTRDTTKHGFNLDRIKRAVDQAMDLTATEREELFWKLEPTFQNQPYIYENHLKDFVKFSV
uniref:Uncharacterized protein n=1 Tax=Cacopsylla melanoneura TaxID=428564 RepID=A0A8D8T254_9HEMI